MLTRHHAKAHPTEPIPIPFAVPTQPPVKRKRPADDPQPTLPKPRPPPTSSTAEDPPRAGPSAPKHVRRSKYVEMAGELEREIQQGQAASTSSRPSSAHVPPSINTDAFISQSFPGSFGLGPYIEMDGRPAVTRQRSSSLVARGLVDPALLVERHDHRQFGYASSSSSSNGRSADPLSCARSVGAPYQLSEGDGTVWGVEPAEAEVAMEDVDWSAIMSNWDEPAADEPVDWQQVEAGMEEQSWMAGHLGPMDDGHPVQLESTPQQSGAVMDPCFRVPDRVHKEKREVSLLSPPDSARSSSSLRPGLPSTTPSPASSLPAGDSHALQQYSSSLRHFASAILSSLPPLSVLIRPFERTAHLPTGSPLTPISPDFTILVPPTILERRALKNKKIGTPAVELPSVQVGPAPKAEPADPPTPVTATEEKTGWFTLGRKDLILTRSRRSAEKVAKS